jgi:hypothetical protein
MATTITTATMATTITTVVNGFCVKIGFGFVRLPRDSCQSFTAFNWVPALRRFSGEHDAIGTVIL